jgi:EAL domain-containing protein (putative c-di-GMP-specific phosphodiesterase class I)
MDTLLQALQAMVDLSMSGEDRLCLSLVLIRHVHGTRSGQPPEPGATRAHMLAVDVRLCERLREGDLLMRMDDEHLAVALLHIDSGHVAPLIRRAHELIHACVLPGHPALGTPHGDLVSAGMSVCPAHATDAAQLVRLAGLALDEAQALGGGRCTVFEPELAQREVDRAAQAELMRAELMAPRDLTLHCLPVVSLADGQVVGLEAFLHWSHPDFAHLTPRALARMADDAGLLDELEHWMLSSACKLGRALHGAGHPGLCLGVNVDTAQLQSRVFPALVACVLAETGFPAASLELAFIEPAWALIREHREVVAALSALGVQLSVDDFGMGLSPIALLKQLKVHGIKIDASLTREMTEDGHARQIVNGVVAMAGQLGLAVTAKGIMTVQQQAALAEAGCASGLGTLWGAPLHAGQVVAMLAGCPHPCCLPFRWH